MEVIGSDGCHGVPMEWDTIEIAGVENPALAPYVGRRLDSWATARHLLLADRLAPSILQHVGHEENVRQIMRHRVHTGGSDGILQGAKPHPGPTARSPSISADTAGSWASSPLEECVSHLTSRPAARLRLRDRGLIKEGYKADVVLFNPHTVAAGSTFENPRTLPRGIPTY